MESKRELPVPKGNLNHLREYLNCHEQTVSKNVDNKEDVSGRQYQLQRNLIMTEKC